VAEKSWDSPEESCKDLWYIVEMTRQAPPTDSSTIISINENNERKVNAAYQPEVNSRLFFVSPLEVRYEATIYTKETSPLSSDIGNMPPFEAGQHSPLLLVSP